MSNSFGTTSLSDIPKESPGSSFDIGDVDFSRRMRYFRSGAKLAYTDYVETSANHSNSSIEPSTKNGNKQSLSSLVANLDFPEKEKCSENTNSLPTKPKKFFSKPPGSYGIGNKSKKPQCTERKRVLSPEDDEPYHRFMRDHLNEKELTYVSDGVAQLGGMISIDAHGFDEIADGLIIGEMKQSEKVICSIASGKFILGTKYISDSISNGKFLPIDKYLIKPTTKMDKTKKQLASAAFYWYNKLQAEPKGKPYAACDSFYIIVESFSKDAEKERNFYELLIRSGGGHLTEHPENATYFLSNIHCNSRSANGIIEKYEKLWPYTPVEHVSLLESMILDP